MANILSFFVPKERKFFPLMEKASGNLTNMSKVLVELVNSHDAIKITELTKKIEDLEHVGDNITHEIFNELSLTFITPFDREDIHGLASVMDDIADYIHGACKRMEIYKVVEMTPEIKKLADLIDKATYELNIAVQELKSLKDVTRMKEALVKINSIENHADDVFDIAVGKLFDEEKDPIKLIKYKEIMQSLEDATDACEDASDVIKEILVKYA